MSNKEVAAELGSNYKPLCSQLTYKADIWNANGRIVERRRKESIQNIIKNASKSMD